MYEILIHDDAYPRKELPAPENEITTATISSYTFRLEGLDGRITEPQSVDELNHLAGQLSSLSEYERVKLEGAMLLTDCGTVFDCVKLMHNLDSFDLTPEVDSLEALGRHWAADDFADTLKDVPPDMMEHLDYETLGRLGWDDDTNAFIRGHHIKDTENELREPDLAGEPNPACLKLKFVSDHNSDGVWMKFPLAGAGDMGAPETSDEMRVALRSLGVGGIEECQARECESQYPALTKCLECHADDSMSDLVYKANNLAYADSELSQYGKGACVKFAAAIEYEDVGDLGFAADITRNLRCYDVAPDAASYAESYLRQKGVDEILTYCFDTEAIGQKLIAQSNMTRVSNGYISRNDHEFIFDRYRPPQPVQEREQRETDLRLVCPLKIQTDPDSELGEEYGEITGRCEMADLPGYVGASYYDEILAAIEKEHMPEEEGRGLAKYLHSETDLAGKISYIWPSVETFDNELYGVIDVRLTRDLSPEEYTELAEYVTGQMSDGWGEGFEQRPVKTSEGDLYISFWQSGGDYFLKPEDEFLQELSGQSQEMRMDM